MCIVFSFSQLLSLHLGIRDGRGSPKFLYDVVPPLLITINGGQVLINSTKHLAQRLSGFWHETAAGPNRFGLFLDTSWLGVAGSRRARLSTGRQQFDLTSGSVLLQKSPDNNRM